MSASGYNQDMVALAGAVRFIIPKSRH